MQLLICPANVYGEGKKRSKERKHARTVDEGGGKKREKKRSRARVFLRNNALNPVTYVEESQLDPSVKYVITMIIWPGFAKKYF